MPDIDPNHPITVESNPRRVTVTLNGFTIASTHLARTLREASYPPVQYIPRDDVQMNLLERTQHHTHCPYKGDASYYTIVAGDVRADNAVWTYEQPKPAAREVAGYLAFYPNKVTIQEE
ncbi:MAG: DUF427 domain-containing protein [Pseudomonadota bacterium]|uniref:DUF427 domain-containing protein n=1 Tax=Ralstonia pickettii TaxID=329 RepID=A0A7X2L9V0_RALPI|nr:DUF427 domain-containing protein [Ralstonia pickettii]MEE2979298.1 DUF427 domain-containing protein [Pseudomonadota bacterium]MRS98240.1 DUF427 domain-containing protein [Ralstonia pickettii]